MSLLVRVLITGKIYIDFRKSHGEELQKKMEDLKTKIEDVTEKREISLQIFVGLS